MSQTNIDNITSTDEEITESIKMRKKYKNKPLDPQYFQKYYHKMFCEGFTCSICGKTLKQSQQIRRHEKSAYCLKAKNKLENQAV